MKPINELYIYRIYLEYSSYIHTYTYNRILLIFSVFRFLFFFGKYFRILKYKLYNKFALSIFFCLYTNILRRIKYLEIM